MAIRLTAVLVSAAMLLGCARAGEIASHPLPAPVLDEPTAAGSETAVFAGGCFWGMQGVFQHVKGVSQVVSGYAGGRKPDGGYEEVSSGTTGNAESIRIVFDPHQVSFGALLRVFFSVMDPTELNYQGPDQGTQYRSAVFATSPMQGKVANAYVAQLAGARVFSAPIVTEVTPFKAFYSAEDYHQDYLIHHPDQPYIAVNDLPKLAALKTLYPALWREKAAMVFPARS
ncbi:MAG: peptide-methionine (S)-S-oxide reductase MsrA [Alphaproteobacteria bacterium]|nr:peptide-methionine (S)-S-oxide reductase MsrA [Alphaproteobacteria bacterium]MBV9694320.1 peptide-methionine (S)-S-oxide reductase MsrA [Alphaproteobacteria bacterium]